MTGVTFAGGWVIVPYSGGDLSRVEIGFGDSTFVEYRGAYLDWHDGQRVAKVRDPQRPKPYEVWLRVDGSTPTKVGSITQ